MKAQHNNNNNRSINNVISKGNAARNRIAALAGGKGSSGSKTLAGKVMTRKSAEDVLAGGKSAVNNKVNNENSNINTTTTTTTTASPAAKKASPVVRKSRSPSLNKSVSKRGAVTKKRGAGASARAILAGKGRRNATTPSAADKAKNKGAAPKDKKVSTPTMTPTPTPTPTPRSSSKLARGAVTSTASPAGFSGSASLQRELAKIKRELEREKQNNLAREREIVKAKAENAGLKKQLKGNTTSRRASKRGPVKSRLSLGENEHGFREISLDDVVQGERLGKGGYGEVYSASWQGNKVAVKIFTDDVSPESIQEFKCEAKILSKLRHPNIVLFMGACTDPKKGLMMMTELLSGGSLFDHLHRRREHFGQMDPVTIKIITDVARACNYLHLHEPQIIHRDLKSSNILLDLYGNAKICDFGTARRHTGDGAMTGEIGTANWTAPEVLRNDKYNEKCDVYSMGMVMWEILHGEMPWTGYSAIQIATTVVSKPGTRLPIRSDLHPAWRELITKCWSETAEERPSFAQILEYLGTHFPSVE